MSIGVIESLQARDSNTVIVGGLALDYCVKVTVLQLRRADFKVIVNLAATGGIAQLAIDASLKQMQQSSILLINSVNELI